MAREKRLGMRWARIERMVLVVVLLSLAVAVAAVMGSFVGATVGGGGAIVSGVLIETLRHVGADP
jgi:hypothetical protein